MKLTKENIMKVMNDHKGDEFDMAGIRQLQKMLGGEA